MEFTQIQPLKQKISRIGLGTWAIGGWMWGGTDEKNAIATIHKALDQGINLIDTAPVYGFGVSEEIVGKALKQYGKRDRVVISTKVGLVWTDPQHVFRDSRKQILQKQLEDSLKRLQTDYIDIYFVHWPDPQTPFDETAENLLQLQKQGKIRAIGVSNFSVDQMEAFRKGGPLHVLQSPFNLFEDAIEKNELAYALKNKIAVLGYGSLCRGMLSGKMSKERHFKGDDLRKDDPKFQEPHFSEYLTCIARLQDWVKKKYNKPLIALAIRWSLDKGIDVALWGGRKPEQMEGIDPIWGWKLTRQDFEEIDRIKRETLLTPLPQKMMAPPDREAM